MAASRSAKSNGKISEFNTAAPLCAPHRAATRRSASHLTATVLPPAARKGLPGLRRATAARLSASLRSAAHRPASPLDTTQRFWFMDFTTATPLDSAHRLAARRISSRHIATPRSSTLRAASHLDAARRRSTQRIALQRCSARFAAIRLRSMRRASPLLASTQRNVFIYPFIYAAQLASAPRITSRRFATQLAATPRCSLQRHATFLNPGDVK
jgi:hypothetical protein